MTDDVLSQNEIDALMSAIRSGEMDADELKKEDQESKVRVYDFKRALRFSKDQIRSIARVHENYARLMTTFFSAQLRTYVDITVASVDQIPYEEFIGSVPKMTVLNIYSLTPLEGRIMMEINPNIAFSMLDRLLGGMGTSVNKIDNITDLETQLMTQLFEKAMVNLQNAWASMVDIEPALEEFEVNPQFLQLVSPNETVVVVSLNTTIGQTSGMINICIPHIVLEPIIPKLSVHHWMQQDNTKERDPESYEKLVSSVKDTDIDAFVELGSTSITIGDFLKLKESDVISLNQPIDEGLKLIVNGQSKFLVQPGKYKNKQAVQVLKDIKRGNGDA